VAPAPALIDVWLDFNRSLVEAASELTAATILDAGRTIDEVEHDVRHWINTQLHQRDTVRRD
jgi:hypothetical protein